MTTARLTNGDSGDAPGAAIRAAMDDAGWSQSDLAYVLGITTAALNQVLAGKRGISLGMSKALGLAFNRPAEDFARLQVEWDLRQAAEADPKVAARAKVLSRYPLRDMVKRGWVSEFDGASPLEDQFCEFFSVTDLDQVPLLSHAAKKTRYDDIPGAQLAWLFRVRQIAQQLPAAIYTKEKLQLAVERFSELRLSPESVRHVPQLLSDAGVRFVVVEGLPNSKIDGVCFWLDDNSPVIGMSLRFDRIDNFWFVLRHECSHVLHGHGKDAEIVDVDVGASGEQNINEEEKIANADAAEFCVSQDKMKSFYLRKKPFFAEVDIIAFSRRMDVHPGLVIGQLHKLMGRYELLRKHLVAVRKHLAKSIMMDGWGDTFPVR